MFTLTSHPSSDPPHFKYSRATCGLCVGQHSPDPPWAGAACFCTSIFHLDGITQHLLLVVGTVASLSVLQSIYFVLLPLDIFALPQDCGLELNDEDGHRCYPLEDHLFCHSCHVKRLEKGPSSAALHQHRF